MPANNECIDWAGVRAQVAAAELRWLTADPGTAVAPDHRLPTADEFWTYVRTIDANPFPPGRVLNWAEMQAHRQLLLSTGAARFVIPAGSYAPWQSAPIAVGNHDWTLEFWARYQAGASVWMASTNPDGTIGAGFSIGVTGNQFRACYGFRYGVTVQTLLFDNVTRTPNTWYHVALTRDATAGTTSFYVNGTLVAQSSAGYEVPDGVPLRLFLGSGFASAPKTQLSTTGATVDLDELRLWSAARTQAQIAAAASAVLTIPAPNLDRVLRFEGTDVDSVTGASIRVAGATVSSFPTDTAF